MSMDHGTPRLIAVDPRFLPVRSVDYCRTLEREPAQSRVNRSLFDLAGRAVKQWDPRLWALQQDDGATPANLSTVYALSGAVLLANSVDGGRQLDLPGLARESLRGWDGRGTQRDVAFDDLLRPVAVFEHAGGQPRTCVERMQYGAPSHGLQAFNQYGQLMRHDDPAGTLSLESFALTGQSLALSRRFSLDGVMPDWPASEADRESLLEPGDGALSTWRLGPLGDVLEQVDARGNRQRQALTREGRLSSSQLLLLGQGQWQSLVSEIDYNAEGRIEREMAGNDVQTTLTYAPEDGWLMERHVRRAGQSLQHLIYAYDPMGNVLGVEDKALPVRYFANQRIDPVSRFRYDSLYQLIEASGWEAGAQSQGPVGRLDPAAFSNYRQTYRYDDSGNLLELTHVGTQNHGRQLRAARYSNRCLPYRNGVPPTEEEIAAAFDARGNCLVLESSRTLAWDLRNQLCSVTPIKRESGFNDSETYIYDGGGQRVRKLRTLHSGARILAAEVRYLPGLELRADSGTGESLQVIIAQGGLGSVRVLHWESTPPSGTNDRYRYGFSEHLGSICLELDRDGRIISQEHFYPFGETAFLAGDDVIEVSYKTVRYSGKERDATGLYYYGYRFYVPWLQRWASPDPAWSIDGLNFYRMVRNNPITLSDTDGRIPTGAAPPPPPMRPSGSPPPPPPPSMGGPPLPPGPGPQQLIKKKWVIEKDPALYKQQGGEYPYYSSFSIALQKLNIEHYSSIADMATFVNAWRDIGRNMIPPARNIDHEKALEVQGVLGEIDAQWSGYRRAEVKEVFRGDSPAILNSYPWLATFATKGGDSAIEKTMNLEIHSPLIMSTAKDPGMGYVSGKSIMWHFQLEPGHAGVSEGLYASEGEVTFPLYNKIQIVSLHYIPKGKSYMNNAERFGTAHRYVIKARMLPRSKSR
ncbi:RHS repeat-associated core domain-containing protein [Pseudomonas corrugata]|uniref:RHS repeat-associated core domain-containing protein n=1 Tax=Pseudomonas corrugata TaxID=47879 RepID=UPI0006D89FEA|nr:RHS repeat-associated core domain-containing protein [Pseudomonas corrugata]